MRHMEIAWKEEGSDVREIGGPQANSRIVGYFHGLGRTDVSSDEIYWCAAAYFWVLMQAGVDISSIPLAERLLAFSATKLGTRIPEPRVGAGYVMPRYEGGRVVGYHVGFVVSWTATSIDLLGGNQANSFNRSTFKRRPGEIFMWPIPPATAKDVAAAGSRTVKAANRQQKDAGKASLSQGVDVAVPDAPAVDPSAFPSPDVVAAKGQALQGWVSHAESFAMFAWGKLGWITLAVTAYYLARMAWDAWQIRRARLQDHNTGKTLFVGASGADAASAPEQEVSLV